MFGNWRAIPGWPAYEVSDRGFIRRDGRLLKPVAVQSGSGKDYRPLYVSLSAGEAFSYKVAHLVLLTFVGEPPTGHVARHLDDNQGNNALSNLAWGTHAENAADRKRNGHTNPGAANGNSRLTEEDVKAIRARYVKQSQQHGLQPLADTFGVSTGTIHDIVTRATWQHV